MKINKTYLAIVLIAFAILSRWLPHPPNFSPVMALALFGGAVFADKKWLFVVPVAGLFISDLLLGFHSLSLLIYVCFAAIAFLGLSLRNKSDHLTSANAKSWGVASVSASLFFFVVSNLGVFFISGMYPLSFAGLMDCFVLALPFFHNTLLSTLFYAGVLFSGYALLHKSETVPSYT